MDETYFALVGGRLALIETYFALDGGRFTLDGTHFALDGVDWPRSRPIFSLLGLLETTHRHPTSDLIGVFTETTRVWADNSHHFLHSGITAAALRFRRLTVHTRVRWIGAGEESGVAAGVAGQRTFQCISLVDILFAAVRNQLWSVSSSLWDRCNAIEEITACGSWVLIVAVRSISVVIFVVEIAA